MARFYREEETLKLLLEGGDGRLGPIEVRRLARMLSALRAAHPAAPSPFFRAATRARLLDEAAKQERAIWERLLARVRAAAIDRNVALRRGLRGVVAVATAVAMMLSGGVVLAASQGAIPGQALYPVKIFWEGTTLWATRADEPKGVLHLDFARRRVTEIAAMADARVRGDGLYEATLRRMDEHAVTGSALLIKVFKEKRRTAVLARLKTFAELQTQDLQASLALIPPTARARAHDSLATLSGIDSRVNALLMGCPCPINPLAPAAGHQEVPAEEEQTAAAQAPACACEEQAPGSGLGPTTDRQQPASPAQATPPKEAPRKPTDRNVAPDVPSTGIAPVDGAADVVDEVVEDVIQGVVPPAGSATFPVDSPVPLGTVQSIRQQPAAGAVPASQDLEAPAPAGVSA